MRNKSILTGTVALVFLGVASLESPSRPVMDNCTGAMIGFAQARYMLGLCQRQIMMDCSPWQVAVIQTAILVDLHCDFE